MLSEFYDFIANNTIDFFREKQDSIRPGERYCLKLDNEEVVAGVDHALRERCKQLSIAGTYDFNDVYSTFTIQINPKLEVVVASKINGMTDDFLATLRNADLTENHFPILMITQTTTIDTITSGTADLSSSGKPFHYSAIEKKIADDIKNLQVSIAEKTLLTLELERKKKDRYSDKSSLFEYKDLLTVLERGNIIRDDFPNFGLLPDDDISFWTDESKIRERLEDNHSLFAVIDKAYRFGNIQEDLENEFGKTLVNQLKERKKNNQNWFDSQTYKSITALKAKRQRTYQNPLNIDDNSFSFFIETGWHNELMPLLAFRNWLVSIRDNEEYRYFYRMNGTVYTRKLQMKADQDGDYLLVPKKGDRKRTIIRLEKDGSFGKNEEFVLINKDDLSLYMKKHNLTFKSTQISKIVLKDHLTGEYFRIGTGPYNEKAKKEIFYNLIKAENEYQSLVNKNVYLITDEEIVEIKKIWFRNSIDTDYIDDVLESFGRKRVDIIQDSFELMNRSYEAKIKDILNKKKLDYEIFNALVIQEKETMNSY